MKKMTNEDFDLKLKDLFNGEIVRQDGCDYIDTKTKIDLKCNVCESLYKYTPRNLFQGYRGCPGCNKRKKLNLEGIIERINSERNGEYVYISGEYNGIHDQLTLKHIECGYEWKTRMSNFFQGKGCPKCANSIKKDTSYVQSLLDSDFPNSFKILSEYQRKDDPLDIKCLTCNNIIHLNYNNIRSKRYSCKYCKQSFGEKTVSNILDELNYDYEYICNLGYGRSLEFDFSVKINNKLYLIEYDGRQHYLPIFGYNEEDRLHTLNRQHKKDLEKNEWCLANNIPLLRIHYSKTRNEILDLIKNFLA